MDSRHGRQTIRVANPFETLREHVQAMSVAHLPELPPFIGGAVGYAGYDTVRYVEDLPNAPQDDRQLPDLWFGLFDHMVVFDHVQKTVIVLALADVRDKNARRRSSKRYADACSRVDGSSSSCRRLDDSLAHGRHPHRGDVTLPFESNLTQSAV